MHQIEKDCLVDFFKVINERYDYIVMRNADELPFDNYSNDIDIMVDEKYYNSFDKTMKEIFLRHGFTRVERATAYGLECYTFYNITHEVPYSIKIDLFFHIEGGGVRYFSFDELILYKVANKNGVYIFDTMTESLITALKILTAGGTLKDKYLNNFINNTPSEEYVLLQKCPSNTLVAYLHEILQTKKNPNSISRGSILREAFLSNIKISPIKTIKRVVSHYYLEVKRAFNKQYMIVLVGPDGSGKTTMINRLLDDSKLVLRSIPERTSIFHHRPHLFRNISDLFKKELTEEEIDERTFNPHSGKTSSTFISFFKLLYYSMDYRLGYIIKIMPLQRENKFIIFDRYFFDFIVDQKRSALKISEKTALVIYKLIVPKPNKVFYIKTDSIEAYNRKKELPVEMIKKINLNYDRMTEKFYYFKIIPNEDFEIAYQEFLKNFIITISEEIKI